MPLAESAGVETNSIAPLTVNSSNGTTYSTQSFSGGCGGGTFAGFDNFSDEQVRTMAQNLANTHSTGLASIYNSLENLIPSTANQSNIDGTLNTTVSDHIKSFLISEHSFSSSELANVPIASNSDLSSIGMDADQIFSFSNGSFIPSSNLRNSITALSNVLSNGYNPSTIETQINGIIDTHTAAIFNKFEKFVFLSCAYVAINSANYWEQNLVSCDNKLQTITSQQMAYAETDNYNGHNSISNMNIDNSSSVTSTLSNQQLHSTNASLIPNYTVAFRIRKEDIVLRDAVGAGTGAVLGALWGGMGGTVVIPGIGTVAGAAAGGLVGMMRGAIQSSVSLWAKSWFQ